MRLGPLWDSLHMQPDGNPQARSGEMIQGVLASPNDAESIPSHPHSKCTLHSWDEVRCSTRNGFLPADIGKDLNARMPRRQRLEGC